MEAKVEEDVLQLFRVRKTVLQMLEDRGYLVSKDVVDKTLEEFRQEMCRDGEVNRDQLVLQGEAKTDREKIMVFFATPDQAKKDVSVTKIRTYVERMRELSIKRGVVIVPTGLSPFAKQILKELPGRGIIMELFRDSELLVNITEHVLVPKHVLLTPDEKKTLLERYKLKEMQLPRIQLSDPVARYYGLQRGQVVKIVRVSETAGKYVTYRFVV
eukprot:TRINITY_DN57054_c0_g1_i1.p3 TRINITY_DN57054_c0_g1~~TRINITY_DN57054_c0_g1_i1.p3  ORF type:complete len:229 (-),score=109.27 TRINITY_DN57054_c0_g1_i1:914-1555(-)